MRSLSRMILAVAVSYGVAALLTIVGERLAAALFGGPAFGAAGANRLAAGVLFQVAAAGVAGYLCARLAPGGRVLPTLGLLLAVFFVAGLVSVRGDTDPHLPRWYFAMVALLAIVGMWAGVMMERAIHGKPA